MRIGRFVVQNEAVDVNYEIAGSLPGSMKGRMTLIDTPPQEISRVILNLLSGNLVTENGRTYRIELTRSRNGLSAEFDVFSLTARETLRMKWITLQH